MDNFIMFDGKKYRLIPEEAQEEPLKEEPMERITGYEKVRDGEPYYFENGKNQIVYSIENGGTVAQKRYEDANYYGDRKLVENNARADRLMRRLRRYAAMHGGIVTQNTQTKNGQKYYIGYTDTNGLIVDWYETNWNNFGLIYFFDKKTAQQALEAFRPELEWYFTEYEPQLL